MAQGKCSTCLLVLNKRNSNTSVFNNGFGLCYTCMHSYYLSRSVNARRRIQSKQNPGKNHVFIYGCNGILPKRRGRNNTFAMWSRSGKGYLWYCRKHEYTRCKEKNLELKLEVFSQYCNGTPHCQCDGCRNGKDNPVHIGALQLDHVVGGGRKDRLPSGHIRTGANLYTHARRNGYPKTYQVLCANCNNNGSKGNKLRCPMFGQSH